MPQRHEPAGTSSSLIPTLTRSGNVCIFVQMSNQKSNRLFAQPACCRLADLLSPKLFKALSAPSRIHLLLQLADCGRPCTVSELADCLQVDVSVVSRHLAALREADILSVEKRGKHVYYSVRYGQVAQTLRGLADAIDACCPSDKELASRLPQESRTPTDTLRLLHHGKDECC